jgi:serine/threonine-protein kinase OSR1/STK39
MPCTACPVLFMHILQGPPPQLEASCGSRHFSRGMREVVARCLNKDPKKRPTAKELLEHK